MYEKSKIIVYTRKQNRKDGQMETGVTKTRKCNNKTKRTDNLRLDTNNNNNNNI
jgi:hypothetical protein